MNIETELRSFITKEQYYSLLDFFKRNATFVKEDYQETHYFDSDADLRIQRNNFYSKLWLKKGKLHDEQHEEIEIKFERCDFEKLEKLFLSLGFTVQIKWFRKRKVFIWDGIKVCLDKTKNYGYIIELEKLCSEDDKEKTLNELKQKFKELNLPITPKEEFEKKFKFYKEKWKIFNN